MTTNKPQPQGVNPWFLVAVIAFMALIVIIYIVATIYRRQTQSLPPAMNANTDTRFLNFHPTPAPTPQKVWPPHPVVLTPPSLPAFRPQQPMAAPTPALSAWETHLLDQKHKALEASLMVKPPTENGQMLETPSLTASNQAPGSSPVVSMQPLPPHTLAPLTVIYAVLETGIRSDHPSDVIARITQPVSDSTLTETLVPAGCMLHGWQGGQNEIEQTDYSVLVKWDQIDCPNRQPVNLPQMPSMDPQGFPGLDGDVNHHYLQVWTPAVLISAITAGMMLAEHPTYGGIQGYNPMQQAFGAGAEALGAQGMAHLGTGIGIKPTITVPQGSLLRVLVTHSLTFDGPYQG